VTVLKLIKKQVSLHLAHRREFHDLRAAGEELLEIQYKIQSKTTPNVFFEEENHY